MIIFIITITIIIIVTIIITVIIIIIIIIISIITIIISSTANVPLKKLEWKIKIVAFRLGLNFSGRVFFPESEFEGGARAPFLNKNW